MSVPKKYESIVGRSQNVRGLECGIDMIGDILCKKDGIGYLYDVKLKFFQENKNMNAFNVTDNEVTNYDQLTKSNKVPVKILINLKKDDGYYYGIFDWSEFTYSKNYNPKKRRQTTARLEDGFDISKLTKFENVKNYKFKKYLDYSKIKKTNYSDKMRGIMFDAGQKVTSHLGEPISKIRSKDTFWSSQIDIFLKSEAEKQEKRTEKQEKRYREKFVLRDEYRRWCKITHSPILVKRLFDEIIKNKPHF